VKRSRSAWAAVAALTLWALAAGCYVPVEKPSGSREALDPCAERLHELAGKLLMYRFAEGRLPASLADLPTAGADERTCPVSGKAYVYRRDGPAAPGGAGRMVAWDATACHNGGRWVVTLAETARGAATAKALWMSEADFQAATGGK